MPRQARLDAPGTLHHVRKPIIVILIFAVAGFVWFVFYHFGVLPYWIVRGKVVDETGNPVENAAVIAHLGVGADSALVETGVGGKFLVRVSVPVWSVCKGGPPSINVKKLGYRPYWGYYKRWAWGPKFTRARITLQKGPSDQPVYNHLSGEESSGVGVSSGVGPR